MKKVAKTRIIPPESLLQGYAQGIFPMAPSKTSTEVEWYTATRRGVIPLDGFKVSKNVQRLIRQQLVDVCYDQHFEAVIRACADRESSWISEVLIQSYVLLHQLGFAHSVEVFRNGTLVGGAYGVALGGAFFGESMFKREKEMDKIALYYLHQRLVKAGFVLWDTQFFTEHLAQFGCVEINSPAYMKKLNAALRIETSW